MIGYLQGQVIEEGPDWVVVLAGQVGYLVYVPLSAMPSVMAGQEEVRFFISTKIVDEIPTLFGFPTREEKELFEALITVSGVGPKAGLKLMSVPVGMLVGAISGGDAAVVCSVKGIGKKTAERVILELKDKIGDMAISACVDSGPMAAARQRPQVNEAVEGLKSLGFNAREVAEAVNKMDPGLLASASTEQIISQALALMGQGKGGE